MRTGAAPLKRRNPRISELRKLASDARERRRRGLILLEGRVALDEALAAGTALEAVYVAEHHTDEVSDLPIGPDVGVHTVADGVLATVGASVSPQPVLAVARFDVPSLGDVLARPTAPTVVAVELSDPGNAGTLVRSAEAAGARGVVLTTGSVDPRSPKVVRASAGSLLRIPVVDGVDAVAALDEARSAGLRLVAANASGTSLWDAELPADFVLVVGSEAHGLAPELTELVDEVVAIPMAAPVESLNVAVSASIVLFEAARRRGTGGTDLPETASGDNLTLS